MMYKASKRAKDVPQRFDCQLCLDTFIRQTVKIILKRHISNVKQDVIYGSCVMLERKRHCKMRQSADLVIGLVLVFL